MTRRRLHPFLSLVTLPALLASPSWASEVSARAAAVSGIRILDAHETLTRHCVRRDGRLMLALPGGAEFELVERTDDPVIHNPGDGAFHPYDIEEVHKALAAITFPLEGIAATVYILPFPRRAGLESAAAPGLVLLSPGVRPLTPAHQHAELTHELGHVVQYARLPDSDTRGWNTYRTLRGIDDASEFTAGATHANRPHEIFAEDFRALFGGPLATTTGTIENAELHVPAGVPGLAEFMLGLADDAPAPAPGLVAWPALTRGAVAFSRLGDRAATLDIHDVAGRVIVSLAPQTSAGIVRWDWDGRDAAGRAVAPGVWFARARDGAGAARVTRLP